ncbi:PAS domain-containing protein [Phenylobacterium sp.]|uniref:sensor histidine kinase n=1 Tax=Phenylobacterium sp. TaxID=1871053 RepID=UPI0025D629FF|nr:PAS domain-containing protein [Phenylobacterium sp.]
MGTTDAESAADSAAARPDFGSLFRALPSPYMILDRDLAYVDANEAYCAVTERRRDELIGRGLFEMFPNPGESGRRLRESLERVLATGRPDSIAFLPYPIPLPLSAGGGFEMRYWSCNHTPLLDAQGRTQFVVQNTVDVTELHQLKQMAYGPEGEPAPGEPDILQRAQEVQATNQSLMRETQGLRDLFMQAPGFMAVLAGPDLRFAFVNNAYQQLIGHRPVVGRTLVEALPEVTEQGFADLLHQVRARREPFVGQAVSVRLQREPEAALEERFLDFVYQPIVLADGEVSGVFVEGSDVTDRVLAERQQKLLVDELNHRVKNTLATVQAIASQTMRTTADPKAFREAFESRLLALSATHDLLTAANWRAADLCDVLLVELRPFGESRYSTHGPDVDLNPAEAVALGLVFHELATNAAKYGALSNADGRVDVAWTREDGRLELTWTESGGPNVTPPTRRGFGSRLIEKSLEGQLAGKARLDFAPGGLVCRVGMPLKG